MSGEDVLKENLKHVKGETCTCCPVCGDSYIHERKTIDPPWRCRAGHEFDEPDERPVNTNHRDINLTEGEEVRAESGGVGEK